MLLRSALLAAILGATPTLGAMSVEPIRPALPPPTIKLPAEEQPVQIESYQAALRVVGLHSETTVTITFRNPNNRLLEGSLEFPLPDGATVSGYALDVGGRMVDGVVVTKQKARVVLEAETRRRVDPGIAEVVRGNQFRTRIYPMPANGTRTVRITWVAPLTMQGGDAAARLPLPRTSLPALDLSIEVAKSSGTPELGGFGNIGLTAWDGGWKAQASLQSVTPGDDLWLRLPRVDREMVNLERSADGETFLALAHQPQLPRMEPPALAPRLALAWDASGSRSPAAIERECAALAALVAARGSLGVDVLVFRNQPEAIRSFELTDGDASPLIEWLGGLAYDGATDLAALDLSTVPEGASHWLLVSDGFHTLGGGLPALGAAPVLTLSAASNRDTAALRFIAEASGGAWIDALQSASDDIVPLLQHSPVRLVRVEDPDAVLSDVHTVNHLSRGSASVYGKVRGAGTVTLVYGQNGSDVHRADIAIDPAQAQEGRLIPRAWAARRAAALGLFPERNAERLRALGNQYGLVTPGTSLLVLESLDQYLRHDVVPPESWPDMRDSFCRQKKQLAQVEQGREDNKLNRVATWWQERVAWYDRKHLIRAGKLDDLTDRLNDALELTGDGRQRRNLPAGTAAVVEPADMEDMDLAVEEVEPEVATGSVTREPAAPPPAPTSPAALAGESPMVFDAPSPADSSAVRELTTRSARPYASSSNGRPGAIGEGGGTTGGWPSGDQGPQAGQPQRQSSGRIAIAAWDPDVPWLKTLAQAAEDDLETSYLDQRILYGNRPGFYLDCAGFLMEKDAKLALRVLSNLAELKIDDAALLRVYAWRLRQAGAWDRAVELLERVQKMRPEEPQSHRDLALALARRYDAEGNRADAVRAADLFWRVVTEQWARFPQIEVIALMERNALIARAKLQPEEVAGGTDTRFERNLDSDVRIVLSWDADVTDVDLHVVEPSGERAYYGHNRTAIGGLVSRDFTQGYGPEEYVLRKAMAGSFGIQCHYYGSAQQTLIGPATVIAEVITDFGRPQEQRQLLTLRLDRPNDRVAIGSVAVDPNALGNQNGTGSVSDLSVGLNEGQVRALLGQPEREEGGALRVLVYKDKGGHDIRCGFGPDLLWVRRIEEGLEVDLLR